MKFTPDMERCTAGAPLNWFTEPQVSVRHGRHVPRHRCGRSSRHPTPQCSSLLTAATGWLGTQPQLCCPFFPFVGPFFLKSNELSCTTWSIKVIFLTTSCVLTPCSTMAPHYISPGSGNPLPGCPKTGKHCRHQANSGYSSLLIVNSFLKEKGKQKSEDGYRSPTHWVPKHRCQHSPPTCLLLGTLR